MYNSKLAKEMIELDHWNHVDAVYAWVEALETAGVDNWDGYDHAREIFKEIVQSIKDGHVQTDA